MTKVIDLEYRHIRIDRHFCSLPADSSRCKTPQYRGVVDLVQKQNIHYSSYDDDRKHKTKLVFMNGFSAYPLRLRMLLVRFPSQLSMTLLGALTRDSTLKRPLS